MSKQLSSKECLAFFIAFGLLPYAGCEKAPTEFYEIKTPPAKLRQIEQFDWEQLKAPPEQSPDVNEPPPGELQLTLQECRALAMSNNLSLKVQLIAPAIAAQQVSLEEAKFEAAFVANASYTKTRLHGRSIKC